jgi:hypothetical protein
MQQVAEAAHAVASKTSGVSYSRKVQAVTNTCARVAAEIKQAKDRVDTEQRQTDGSDIGSTTQSAQGQRTVQTTASDALRSETLQATTGPSRIGSSDQLLTLGPIPVNPGSDGSSLLDFNPSSTHLPRDIDFPMADFAMPEGPYSNYGLYRNQSWPTPSRILSPVNSNAVAPPISATSTIATTAESQMPTSASPDALRFSGIDSRYWIGESGDSDIFSTFGGQSGGWL